MLTFRLPERPRPRELWAFGERKSIAEWLDDSICKVSRDLLMHRLQRGWCAEWALSRPARKKLEITGGPSQYRGVCFHRRQNRWMAKITHQRRSITIGYFKTELEAAKAFDRKAKQLRAQTRF